MEFPVLFKRVILLPLTVLAIPEMELKDALVNRMTVVEAAGVAIVAFDPVVTASATLLVRFQPPDIAKVETEVVPELVIPVRPVKTPASDKIPIDAWPSFPVVPSALIKALSVAVVTELLKSPKL